MGITRPSAELNKCDLGGHDMTQLIPVQENTGGNSNGPVGEHAARSLSYCEQLEEGNILFFARSPIAIPESDREFLLSQRQSGAAYHKNIAYRPQEDRVSGLVKRSAGDQERLRTILRNYSKQVTQFIVKLLPSYAGAAHVDFASFRPQEERGRPARLNARNDLLHVDAFPTRPTYGDRTLRFFNNINPTEPRVWLTSETFEGLAQRFAGPHATPGLFPTPAKGASPLNSVGKSLRRWARAVGLPVRPASPFDDFMHRFHNFLKQNSEFQATCPKTRWEFPPNSSWIVLTDAVSHAVLSGQFALEQTFLIPRSVLVLPEKAPINILERLCGRPLTDNGTVINRS